MKMFKDGTWLMWLALTMMFMFFVMLPTGAATEPKQPIIEYTNQDEFITSVQSCATFENSLLNENDHVPVEIITAMAVLETGYGKSRFANVANNLFGIRTWDLSTPHVKPLGYEGDEIKWAVKKYDTKCDSVKHMISILNNLHFYEKFREAREQFFNFRGVSLYDMVHTLHPWSTNPEYTNLINNRVKHIEVAFSD